MERLTDCAQGYCEVYCDFYASCFSEPDVCERKYEVQLYERLKDYEISALREQDNRIESDTVKNGWIGVEERLPDEKGEYLTYDQWGFGAVIKTAYWTPKYDGFDECLRGRAIWYNYDSEYGCYELTGITHWMPLPESPKEEV